MLKLLGACLVVLACTWIGFQIAAHYRKRPQQIRQMYTALSLFEMEIMYGNRPLLHICEEIAEREAGIVGQIFAVSAQNLAELDGESTFSCFQQAIEQVWHFSAMEKNEKKILLDLSATLGRSNRGDQIQHVQAAKANLKIEEKKSRQEQEQYEKMFRTMGLLTGALLVILLY